MKNKTSHIFTWILALLITLPFSASAEQMKEYGKYIVHYNALQTNFLDAKVARNYNIKRSKNRIMLNIAIKEKVEGKQPKSVIATVNASAVNLTGQLKKIDMRPIHDGTVIYYIGETSVENKETLDFIVNVTPENSQKVKSLRFRQQFFTD